MSNDLCSPFNCNICLMLESEQEEYKNQLIPRNKFQNLLNCNGCRLVRYCSTDHQKLDWPIHRPFCKAVQKIRQGLNVSNPFYIGEMPQNKEEVEIAIVKLKYLLRRALGRSLQFQEEELTSFPPLCGQCFKFNKLKIVCEKCHSQLYCTEQHREIHKEHHEKVCKLLQIYYCPYKVLPFNKEFPVKFNSGLKDLDKLDLTECIQRVFSVTLPPEPCQTKNTYQLFSWASDFSCILTICYVINLLQIKSANLARLQVFIVGASIEATLWFREIHCKLFFLQNPQTKELILEFIGPEVVEPEYQELKFSFLGSTRVVKLKTFKGLYQDYCKQQNRVTPSLIMIFNCGFSEFAQYYSLSPKIRSLNTLKSLPTTTCENVSANDTWFAALIEILQTLETPIAFTSYTEQESHFDFAAIKDIALDQNLDVQIDQLIKSSTNPFRDLRPLRQWYSLDEEQFYYRNGYIQAIRTKLDN